MRQKNRIVIILSGLIMALLIPCYTAFAVSGISGGQTIQKDWIAVDQSINNEGTIKGDMISLGQYITSSGIVEGDMLGASMDISLSGSVKGDARLAGSNIKISGEIGKNVNIFSNLVRIEKTAGLGGNLILFANDIEVAGDVKGHTKIGGSKIVLSGEFFGDVDVNVDNEFGSSDVILHILPETKIHGKLTYKGINEALVESGSSISNFEWIKAEEKKADSNHNGVLFQIQKYSKILITVVIYFFISMLIYRLFPRLFTYQGKIIRQKPLHVFGIGLAAIALILAAIITFIFLLAVTIFIAKPVIAFIFAAVMSLTYIILFYFSLIPASMCLGNMILDNRYNVPVRFGTGLLMITITMSILSVMGEIHGVGLIFSALRIIAVFSIGVMGVGAILYTSGEAFVKLRNSGKQ